MGALGFKEAPILTYLMRWNRCRDSPRSRSSTNKVLRARSDLLVVLGDDVVRVAEELRKQPSSTTLKTQQNKSLVGELPAVPSG